MTPVVTLILYDPPLARQPLGSIVNVLLLFEADGDEDICSQKPSTKKTELVSAFDRYQDAGILASRLMLFDRRDVFHAAGDLFRSDGTSANRGVWQKDVGQYSEGYVFSACGGAACPFAL